MLTITDGGSLTRALDSPLDQSIKRLLTRRCTQLRGDIRDKAQFVVAQPGDCLALIEDALGFSPLENAGDGSRFGERDYSPGWEWMQNHCTCFELLFVLDDGGFAHVLIVQKGSGMDPQLIRLCELYSSEHA